MSDNAVSTEGVTTRSKSQSDKEEKDERPDDNMASNIKETIDPTRVKAIARNNKSEKTKAAEDKEVDKDQSKIINTNKNEKSSKNENAVMQNKMQMANSNASAIDQHDNAIVKGTVPNRVERINSTPNTPTSTSRMPKVKSAIKQQSKLRTLVAQNGQLSIEGQDKSQITTALRSQGASLLEDDSEEEASLTSILHELSTTVKRLEKKLDRMDKDRQQTEVKISQFEVVQQQESARVEGLTSKVEEQQSKINALIDTVVRQDQQIQALTNQMNSAYALKNQRNLIINGIPETPGENCFHEVAHFLKYAMKLDKIPLKFAKKVGKRQI